MVLLKNGKKHCDCVRSNSDFMVLDDRWMSVMFIFGIMLTVGLVI